jgi:mono/diheme cytochrome c family protein
MSRRRFILLSIAAVAVIGVSFLAWMVFQPGPYAFAAGYPVGLASYAGPSPTGVTGVRAINDVSAANVVQMILTGTESIKTGRPYMPGFATIYSDADIAAVANYFTRRFGSVASSATPQQVAMLRLQH